MTASENKSIGRLVYTGSIAWDWIGRKTANAAPKKEILNALEYAAPHVYGPAAYINVKQAITHCSSSHCILIDGRIDLTVDQGVAYSFGRNDKGQLGDGTLKPRDEPFKIDLDEKVVAAATGKSHTILITESGKVYASGENKLWQTLGKASADIKEFTQVTDLPEDEKFVEASCGGEYSIVLSESGKLYAWGNPQYGQLGDGADHSYIGATNKMIYDPQPPKPVLGLEKKIVQVVSGVNHNHCLDEEGTVYSWGYAGYGRLGLNEHPPKDIMVPVVMAGFTDRKNPAKKLAAGPACGMAIDSRDTLQVWGKWKNSGDGGQGTPWLYPKYFTGLNGWEIRDIACGGSQLFALADQSCISWGQSCVHGELGHGDNKPRSATNAVKVDTLEDFKVLSVSCGAGHTLLVVDQNDPKFAELPVALTLVETAPTGDAKKAKPTKKEPAPKKETVKKEAKKRKAQEEEEEEVVPKSTRPRRGQKN